jgi:hypothetical protein
MMFAANRMELPVALEGDDVEVRAAEVGEFTMGWFQLDKGADLGPAPLVKP